MNSYPSPFPCNEGYIGTASAQWNAWLQDRNHHRTPSLQRSTSVTHTLPGHLQEATPGHHTIIASHDMSPFLCTLSATGVTTAELQPAPKDEVGGGTCSAEQRQLVAGEDGIIYNIPATAALRLTTTSSSSSSSSHPAPSASSGHLPGSRSGVVCLDWSVPSVGRLLLSGGASPSSRPSEEPRSSGCGWGGAKKICTISRVAGQKITLDSPYLGPAVHNGFPRVYLRTNLTPSVPPPACNLPMRGPAATLCSEGWPGQVLARISLSQPATALEAHPYLPYAVAGCWDDSITVVSPHPSSRGE
jgi:hypothetical protein